MMNILTFYSVFYPDVIVIQDACSNSKYYNLLLTVVLPA